MTTLILTLLLAGVGVLLLRLRSSVPRGGDLRTAERLQQALMVGGYAAVAIAAIVLVTGSLVTVQPGAAGVKILFGGVDTDVLTNGFHVINPLAHVVEMDARTQAYTMSGKANEGQVQGDDAIKVLSRDGLTLDLEVTIQYHLLASAAPRVYKELGADYVEKIVRPEARSALRDAAVRFDATGLYSTDRDKFVDIVKAKLEQSFLKRGIVMENVLLRDVQLPMKVRAAIDEKISAEQEAQKMQYVLQREKQEAERKRLEAAGISDAQKIIASSLTNQYLQYNYMTTLKELAGSKTSTFVITPFDQKLTPMLNVK